MAGTDIFDITKYLDDYKKFFSKEGKRIFNNYLSDTSKTDATKYIRISDQAFIEEESRISNYLSGFIEKDTFFKENSSFIDKLNSYSKELSRFSSLSDEEKLIVYFLAKNKEKKEKKSSFLNRLLDPIMDILLNGVPNFISPSFFQVALQKFFLVNEDLLQRSKFEFIIIDTSIFSKLPTSFDDFGLSYLKKLFNFSKDPFRLVMDLVIKLYYSVSISLQIKKELTYVKSNALDLYTSVYTILLSLFLESIVFRYFSKSISGISLPEITVERIGENDPSYYITGVKPKVDNIQVTFLDSKRGTVLRMLEAYRSRIFSFRKNGFLFSDPNKGYVVNSEILGESRYIGMIIPIGPSSLRFTNDTIKKFKLLKENRILLYPRIILYDLIPTNIEFGEFSHESSDPMEYNVTFACSDVQIGRLI